MSDAHHPPVPADACQTMADVRAGVDALDRALINLLAQRFAFMNAAARIKPERHQVRDEPRKAEVIANAAAAAKAAGLPDGLAETLWELLVESSIAHELTRWDGLHKP